MKYAVDRIEENIVILENLETRKILEVKRSDVPNIKEGDILEFCDGVYRLDESETIDRKTMMREKLNRLKKGN